MRSSRGKPRCAAYGRPARIASALDIMLEGPIGAAAFNNEFGRPNLTGYFRTYEQRVGEGAEAVVRGYHKPIMVAGGVGNIADSQAIKAAAFAPGTLLIQLGGPGMLIGLGGGAASSMSTGSNSEALDFASVQRGNPEMQRRAQEVIDRCWQMGAPRATPRRRAPATRFSPCMTLAPAACPMPFPNWRMAPAAVRDFELREVQTEEPGMSPAEIWSNEAQERYVLAIPPGRLPEFKALCERERCPFAVVGVATDDKRLLVADRHFGDNPVDMDMDALLGKPPRMTRTVQPLPSAEVPFDATSVELKDAAYRVLRLPAVANKTFLISIGDRTVGGMTARDQMVGPWQVPVADVAVTTMGFRTFLGEAFAIGERTPLAILDAPASGRMAVGEALTNLLAAPIELERVKLSANWMAAAGVPGEDARLFDTVRAVSDLCQQIGVSIPVGKDSLSMRTAWDDGGQMKQVVSPLSLIVTGFARVRDARRTLTPQLRLRCRRDRSAADRSGRRPEPPWRLGAGAGVQRHRFGGAGRRRSGTPGGILCEPCRSSPVTTCCLPITTARMAACSPPYAEMAFAGHCGVSLDMDGLCYDPLTSDVDGAEKKPDLLRGRAFELLMRALFNEELGAVVQIRRTDRAAVMSLLRAAGLGACTHFIGAPNPWDEIRVIRNAKAVLRENARRSAACLVGNELSHAIAARQPGMRAAGIRPHSRHGRHRFFGDAQFRSGREYRRAADQPRECVPRSPSCASRASMATSKWRQHLIAPALPQSMCT